MAPRPRVDYIYLYFNYEPTKRLKDSDVKCEENNTNAADFLVSGSRDWALQMLESEVTKLPRDTQIRFTEWRFKTSDLELFTLQDTHFKKVLIILGGDYVYWSFSMLTQHGKRVQGKAQLEVSYCPCCVDKHYSKIFDVVKAHIAKKAAK